MAQKEKLSQAALTVVPHPPTWVMDVLVANLFEQGGAKAKIAIKISSLILEYDKKCSQAKIDLYNKVQKLLEL
jgi:hypothetical protein